MPIRSGCEPEASDWASFGTIWSCSMYVRLMGRFGLLAFHPQTIESTNCLFAPVRSHICMALDELVTAQADAWSGVCAPAAAGSEAATSKTPEIPVSHTETRDRRL